MRKLSAVVLAVAIAGAVSPIKLSAFTGAPLQADQTTGNIAGKTVQNNNPLANAKVQITKQGSTAPAQSLTSNADGTFTATGLQPGTYTVQIMDATGTNVIGTATVTVQAGFTASVTVGVTAAVAAATGLSTAALLAIVGGTVAGVGLAVVETASPSR